MRFEKVLLVGSGKIACDCLRYLVTLVNAEELIALETQNNALSMFARICKKENVDYYILENKKGIEAFLLQKTRGGNTLIISANNGYIFTSQIIEKENVEIINFHYSLLPHYRGMNIPTWVIYNKEKQTGITWHYVTAKIDHGRIIAQRTIPIHPTTTAFEITRKGMDLGIEAFRSFIEVLLEQPMEGKDVNYLEHEKIYYNSKLPMSGIIDLEHSIEDIACLLRCFDYGGLEVVPFLRVNYQGEEYIVKKYAIKKGEGSEIRNMKLVDGRLIISEGNNQVTLQLQSNGLGN